MRCCTDGDHAESIVSGSSNSSVPALPANRSPTASWLRRIATFVQLAFPVAVLALIPKCPACIAAYVLLFTGIGLSFEAASAMRWTLIASSVVALTYLAIRKTSRVLRVRRVLRP